MLNIRTTYPRFDLEYHWPRMEIEHRVSQVQIERSGPTIEIDQLQSRNELGIGGYQYLSKKIREQGYQKVLAGIAKMAQEGDEVMNRAGHFREEMIFSDQAKRRMDEQMPELNVASAPSSRPKIRFHYEQEITWDQGGALIKHHIQPPTINWQLGEVKVEYVG